MSINEECDAEKITSLVGKHVPKAKLARQHEAEMTFTLPFESMDTFSGQITLSGKAFICYTHTTAQKMYIVSSDFQRPSCLYYSESHPDKC